MRSLASFQGIHSEEKVVVCGCGVSLNDVERPEQFVTIGVNDVGRLFQPKYLLVVDPKERFKGDRFHYVETSQAEYLFTQLTELGISHPNIVNFLLGKKNGTDFLDPNVLHYSVVTPYMALYLAAHMGATRIGLIGVDFTDHHFFGNTGPHEWAPHLADIDEQFRRLGDVLLARGTKVFNLSRTSRLTAFPKMAPAAFATLPVLSASESPHPATLRIVSYASTPVAGTLAVLARCINARTPHCCRFLWAGGDSSNGVPYQDDINWNQSPARALAELTAADVVLVHNGKVDAQHRHLLAGKAVITVAHNDLWNVDQSFIKQGFPGMVVGQYQATLPELKEWMVVPNPVERGPEDLATQGASNRLWMKRHWDFASQWERSWQPVIEKGIRVAEYAAKASQRAKKAVSSQSASVGVSVVVVNLNEGEYLRRTVDSLAASLPDDGEIIVVDDGSEDGSADFLNAGYDRVTLLRPGERLGSARARNFGAQRARGRTLTFCDAHVAVPPDWVGPLLAKLEIPDVGAVMPAIRVMRYPDDYISTNPSKEARGYGLRWRDAALGVEWLGCKGPEPYPVPLLGAAFLAMRRNLFAAIGGFDSGLAVWGSEDAELSIRLWTLGYECLVVPGVDVAHRFRNERPYRVEWEMVLYNKLRLAAIHFGPERRQLVTERLRQNGAFSAAVARLDSSDAETRRDQIRSLRRYDDDWFFQRFRREVPSELKDINQVHEPLGTRRVGL